MSFIRSKQFRTVLRCITLIVIIVNTALAYFDIIDVKQAVFITIGLECCIALIFVFFVSQGVRSYREERRQGSSFSAASQKFIAEVVPSPVMKLAKHELDMWKLLGFLIRRKINAPAGATTFGYGSEQRAIFIALVIVSIIEIVVVELLVPWKTVRIIILILSIYGAIWLLLFFKSYRINPHYIHEEALVLRVGLISEITVATNNIKSIHKMQKTWGNKFLSIENGAAVIKYGSDTNIELLLHEPTTEITHDNNEPVDRVYFTVDNPQEIVGVCKTKIIQP